MTVVMNLTHKKITEDEVLYGVSCEQYESLIKKYWNLPSPRLTYDSGILEINMSNSSNHEIDNRNLSLLLQTILMELEIEHQNCGSTTFTKKGIRKGFEPDSCFYIDSLAKIEGKTNLGVENEIAPDLIIEVNRTSSSVPRMPIFAAFGVKEIWRLSKNEVRFYTLEEGVYLETENSITVPILTSQKATEFLLDAQKLGNVAWAKKIKHWTSKVQS